MDPMTGYFNNSTYYWHIHHQQLIERESLDGIKRRKEFIRYNKLNSEIKLRLKLIKKARIPKNLEGKIFDPETLPKIIELHAKQCNPKCPWRFHDEKNPEIDDGNIFWNKNYDEKKNLFTLLP